MAILHFLADQKQCGWDVSLSKICAAEIAMLNNFVWNEMWTFRGSPDGSSMQARWPMRLLKFNAICSVGIGFAVLFLNLFYRRLRLDLYVANFLAIMLVTLWNFWMNAILNWRRTKARHAKNTRKILREELPH